jgi:murein L,D-transpeptidase YcbB/YkuD
VYTFSCKCLKLLQCFVVFVAALSASSTVAIATINDDSVRRAIAEYLDSGAALPLSIKAHKEGLRSYYITQSGPFLWTRPAKLDAFAEMLEKSSQDGLSPGDYALKHIRTLRDTLHSKDSRLRAWLELSYSSFLIRYAQDLGGGRILPTKIAPEIFIARKRASASNILKAFSSSGTLDDFSVSQMPADQQYQRLRKKLVDFQLIAQGGGWPPVAGGKPLKLEASGKRVERMRTRLEFTGDIEYVEQKRAVFDTGLEDAVKRYQARHGMKPDGTAGRRVIVSMNIPASDRVRQIEVNMERWRWIRDVQSERVLTVNLANSTFRYTVGDKLVQETRLEKRKGDAKTPVFSDQVQSMTVRPSDIVPPEIAGPVYFDIARKDPKKFARQGMEIFYEGRNVPAEAIDWASYSAKNFPFTMRRPLRKGDPAGYVRLIFSESESVCLGGAVPHKGGKKTDKFAPNCLIFARADEFADALLRQNQQTLDAILASEKRQHAVYSSPFDQPIPVRILYATAWVDDDGALNFRPDTAHRDLKLYKALEGRHSPR